MATKELKIILGPTGVGKTDYSIELANEYRCPIINCDSRQIFKEMSIGTAVPSREQLALAKHYFIQTHSVETHYTAGLYEIEALELINELFKTHDTLIMCGGSALYIDALCFGLDNFPAADIALREKLNQRFKDEGIEALQLELKELDPESYNNLEISNARRVIRAIEVTIQTGKKYSSFKTNQSIKRPFEITRTCLVRPREELYDRINRRVDIMLDMGLLKEVESLMPFKNLPALNTVGYREIFEYLDGIHSLEKAIELIKRNSRRYAKKQLTWWRDEIKLPR